jgi:hypothetical protein
VLFTAAYYESILLWSCHFLQSDMNTPIACDPIFGIRRSVDEYKTTIASIPNIGSLGSGYEIDQHIAFQKKT